MAGLDKVIVSSLAKVAKDSGKLNNAIDAIKDKVLAKGLELIEEAGIDSSQLPVNLPQYLRGESPSAPDTLSSPRNVCNMPALTAQQIETTTRLVNSAQEEIEQIFATTNRIKATLVDIKKPISGLQTTVQPIESTVSGVSNAIKIIKLLPFPVAVLGVGIPANILTIFSATLDSLDKLLGVASSNLKMIPQTLEIMVRQINGTIQKLNQVEQVIEPFLQTLIFIKATAELRPNCPDVTQEDINNSKDDLLDGIQGSLAVAESIENPFALSEEELEAELQENSDPGLVYKNFKFVLEYDPNNTFAFPSRRIKCTRPNSAGFTSSGIPGGGQVTIYNINELTNPSLEIGAYSYSSNLKVLVEEAKFAVDQYTLNVTVWSAPQLRDKVQVEGDGFIDLADLSPEELRRLGLFLNIDPVILASGGASGTPLPNYIQYGGSIVNLNNSPTDIESGADRLYGDSRSSGNMITSYIQSGTIQVNRPVLLRMKTFGGTGNAADGYTTGFTEALLTVKRSFSIQDDIDPFTGKVAGFDQDAINTFEDKYGSNSLNILDSVYETLNEANPGFSNKDREGDTYFRRLKRVRTLVKEFASLQLGFYDISGAIGFSNFISLQNTLDVGADISVNYINKLYDKTKPLLYAEDVLWLSRKLFGNSSGYRTGSFIKDLKKDKVYNNQNWYWTARKNAFDEDVGTSGNIKDKAVTLTMAYLAFKQFRTEYNNLFGNRREYNDGSWVGAASTVPIIPTSATGDLDDITVIIQHQQEIGRNETITEDIGSLDLLGTYSYDLEIINSLPAVGGPETNYPTNFTRFEIIETQESPYSVEE